MLCGDHDVSHVGDSNGRISHVIRTLAWPLLALVFCLVPSCGDGGSVSIPMDAGRDQEWTDGEGDDGTDAPWDLPPDTGDLLTDTDPLPADAHDAVLDFEDLPDDTMDAEDTLETMDGGEELPDIPDEIPCTEWFPDVDGDGWGAGVPACLVAPDDVFTSPDPGDCDDDDPDIHPGAEEICNGLDDDCDDAIDPVHICPDIAYYCDDDSDGVQAHEASGICSAFACVPETCSPVAGGDCDDGNPGIHPAAPELCNGADEDCDSFIDEDGACPPRSPTTATGTGTVRCPPRSPADATS